MQHISPERLKQDLLNLGSGLTLTHGRFELPARCEISDLEWNQMDQDHRPWIHRTYLAGLRIVTAKDSQLSLSQLKILGIPLFVSVSDFRIKPGFYYQGYSVFSVAYVHALTYCKEGMHVGEWYIVSHWLFKPLQWWIHRKLTRMNVVQNGEDQPVRDRRADLRKQGYTFAHDQNQDFVTANTKTSNVCFPRLKDPISFQLDGLRSDETRKFAKGSLELVVKAQGDGRFGVWHGVCPHEGGPLDQGSFCEGALRCPWHGLTFKGVELSSTAPTQVLDHLQLELRPDLSLFVSDRR